jgi:hypothetical protein
MKTEPVIAEIISAFGDNEYPGDEYLLGSREGCEPFEEIQPFIGQADWKNVPAKLMDDHSGALHFFSEAGLRFYLPAYLVADLREELQSAEPVFTLTNGFSNLSVPHEIDGQIFIHKTGKDAFINPKRYGALTFEDYARFRLSVFTRQEAKAITSYLEFKRDQVSLAFEREQIVAALDAFWYQRGKTAPSGQQLDT